MGGQNETSFLRGNHLTHMENIPQLPFISPCINHTLITQSSALIRPWHSLRSAEQGYSLMKLLRFSSTCLTGPCSFVPHQLGPNL